MLCMCQPFAKLATAGQATVDYKTLFSEKAGSMSQFREWKIFIGGDSS